MLRLRLDGRHQGQHLPAIEAFGHDEIGQLRLALGEGASLVESDHLRVAQRLQRLALSEENTHLGRAAGRSEEHTSELQSLMRISYAVFCLKKKNKLMNSRNPF